MPEGKEGESEKTNSEIVTVVLALRTPRRINTPVPLVRATEAPFELLTDSETVAMGVGVLVKVLVGPGVGVGTGAVGIVWALQASPKTTIPAKAKATWI